MVWQPKNSIIEPYSSLPEAKIIGAEVEATDTIWIGEVFGLVISFGS
jgi:hypothetical protein